MGITGTGLRDVRRAVELAHTAPQLADTTFGTFAMRELDEKLPIFARDEAGTSLEPVTKAAGQILSGSDGQRARRILDAAVAQADERANSPLRGLVLPDDPDALTGWWRLREVADHSARHPDDRYPEIVASIVEMESAQTAANAAEAFTNAAHYERGFAVDLSGSPIRSLLERRKFDAAAQIRTLLGPDASDHEIAKLVEATKDHAQQAARTRQLATLSHEFEHADGILDYRTGPKERAELTRIFEEGGNNVITHWPGRLAALGERAGIAGELDAVTITSSKAHSYEDETEVMRGLVARAGIDVDDPGSARAAASLLRGRRYYDEAIEDIARAVGRHEGRDVNPYELQQAMLATPATDRFHARLEAIMKQTDTSASAVPAVG
ncbi:MAG: hypothetical protein KDC46_12980 [Thermoleophilia bacterium]|nr:hypothetical protein [Thermoleophilia bacterium]